MADELARIGSDGGGATPDAEKFHEPVADAMKIIKDGKHDHFQHLGHLMLNPLFCTGAREKCAEYFSKDKDLLAVWAAHELSDDNIAAVKKVLLWKLWSEASEQQKALMADPAVQANLKALESKRREDFSQR